MSRFPTAASPLLFVELAGTVLDWTVRPMELDKIISSRQRPLSLLGEEEPADARGPLSPPPQVTDGLRTGSGRVCDGVLEAIGQTPLIRLRRYLPHARFHLYA